MTPSIPATDYIAARLGEITGANVDPTDSLLSLGLDSLAMLEVLVLCEEFAPGIDPDRLSIASSVGDLARIVAAAAVDVDMR